ncbi:MAG: DUF3347 domain-containing protein [Chitinophagaceae bacterium]
MSKICLCIIVGLIWVGGSSCHFVSSPPAQKDSTLKIMPVSHQSPAVYQRMDLILTAYFQLKNAIFNEDTTSSNQTANGLESQLKRLDVHPFQENPEKFKRAHLIVDSLSIDIQGLLGKNNFRGKRLEFSMISNLMDQFIQNVGLKSRTVYWQYCPMANGDKGAYWLNDSPGISNPYFGKQMPDCGQTRETLQF